MTSNHDDVQRVRDSMEGTEKVVLYTIGSNNIPIHNLVNLQKVIFLSSRSLPDILGGSFNFEAHKKGPYCSDIDETVLDLSSSGLLDSKDLTLSDRGECIYKAVEEGIREPLKSTIDYWKEFQDGLTEDELLTFVYSTYPETVRNSEVIDRLRRNFRKNTISLVTKNKISVGKGSEMLGIGYVKFEELLKKEGVRWKS